MATTLKRMPPPPPIASNDPAFNRWLHDMTAFIAEGGGLDPGIIPGYDTLVSTVAQHTIKIASNTVDISQNTTNIATNTSAIATHTSQIATHTSQISTLTSNVSTLTARSQVFNGGAAPVAGLGVSGDWYADTTGKHIHVKVGGAWVQIV